MPTRTALSDEVYTVLRESLVTRRIVPGAKLNLDRLARSLHVSNTPVRQALTRLVGEGLVTQTPYRGFTASPLLDMQAVTEIYEYRLLVEPAVVALAAKRRTGAEAEALAAMCEPDRIEAQLRSQPLANTLASLDEQFHTMIAAATHNAVVLDSLPPALRRMQMHAMYADTETGRLAWDEHRVIAQAIAAGDQVSSATAMQAHLRSSLKRMRDRLHLADG